MSHLNAILKQQKQVPGVSMMLRRKDFPCWFGRMTVIGVDLMLKSLSRSIGCVSVYLIFSFPKEKNNNPKAQRKGVRLCQTVREKRRQKGRNAETQKGQKGRREVISGHIPVC